MERGFATRHADEYLFVLFLDVAKNVGWLDISYGYVYDMSEAN